MIKYTLINPTNHPRQSDKLTRLDKLQQFEATFQSQQEPLGEPFTTILFENLNELYETGD